MKFLKLEFEELKNFKLEQKISFESRSVLDCHFHLEGFKISEKFLSHNL